MPTPVTVGVSLKMYFDPTRSRSWFEDVAEVASRNDGIRSGAVELFVIPSFLSIPDAVAAFAGTAVAVGAQDLFWEDRGAFTGEISGADLAALGVSVVEVGHAERRALFGEDDAVIARKTDAALRNGITPVLCIGESTPGNPTDAASFCIAQLDAALEGAAAGRVIVAYEPVWAIGAAEPASSEHVDAVCAEIRKHLDTLGDRERSSVIYGGSAKPGLLGRLGTNVDGLFLGRFAHDPVALEGILDEATLRSAT
jgi:triosephosphate isomerase